MTAYEGVLCAATAALAVVAGGQLFVLVTVIPVKRRWPEAFAQRVHHELLSDPADHFLRPMLTVGFALGVLAFALHRKLDTAGVLNLVALLGCVGVMVTSFRVNFEVNRAVAELPAEGPAGQYLGIAGRWERGHLIRTTCGTLAFLALLLAVATA